MYVNRFEKTEFGLFRYALLYSELAGQLENLKNKYPLHFHYESYGQSHNGRDLYLVVLAKEVRAEALADYQKNRQALLTNPRDYLEKGRDKRLPLQFNCNCHGNEISGTDGLLAFVEKFMASPERDQILEQNVILITICMNPDGRAKGQDILNGHGFDLNREWMTQSQPETRCMIEGVLTKYFPAILVDMHGFMSSTNLLIDGCTAPHNPLVEYDLLEQTMLANCRAMAQKIKAETGLEVDVPALIWDDGWEDYSPIYTPCYHMMFGAIAHTVETNFPSEEGAEICRLCAEATVKFACVNHGSIFTNQCLYYLRGQENKPLPNLDLPNFYIIPNHQGAQKDLDIVADTVRILLRNKISVYVDDEGRYVIPSAQSLRPVIHNMLWVGEDITDKINNCYDTSFYSYPLMRGFKVLCEKNFEGRLRPIEAPRPVPGLVEVEAGDDFLKIKGNSISSYRLANDLLQLTEVYRLTESGKSGRAGDFLVLNEPSVRRLVENRAEYNDIRAKSLQWTGVGQKLEKSRLLVVADSGGIYEFLRENGFQVTFVPFCELNLGYKLNPDDYDVLIVGGTKQSLWEDQFDDRLGIGFQNSWGLRERGRQEIIEKAKLMKKFIFYNYAGLKMLAALNLGPYQELEPPKADVQKNMEWILSVPNGSFRVKTDPDSPICYGYDEDELFYLVNPLAFESGGRETALKYAPNAFVNGFNKLGQAYDNRLASFYDLTSDRRFVYFSFDPTFRKYLDYTAPLVFNSVLALTAG